MKKTLLMLLCFLLCVPVCATANDNRKVWELEEIELKKVILDEMNNMPDNRVTTKMSVQISDNNKDIDDVMDFINQILPNAILDTDWLSFIGTIIIELPEASVADIKEAVIVLNTYKNVTASPKYITDPPTVGPVPHLPLPSQPSIVIQVNGSALSIDVSPIMENDRVLVPMRAIFENLGAEVFWDSSTQTVAALRDDTAIVIQIDNPIMVKNVENIVLDVPPKLLEGRTLVSISTIIEGLDVTVDWNEDRQDVTIISN